MFLKNFFTSHRILLLEKLDYKKIVSHNVERILYGKSNDAVFGLAVSCSYLYPLAPVVFGVGEGIKRIFLDFRIGGVIDNGGHVELFQRELHLHRFSVDLSLGKCNNRFIVAFLW